MQIAQLEKSASLTDVAARVYRLGRGDPQLAAAEKALAAANPHIGGNLAALPPHTPVVVPNLPGLTATVSNPIDPSRVALVRMLEQVQKTAEQASNAQLSGSTAVLPAEANPERDRALKRLRDDIASFSKIHVS